MAFADPQTGRVIQNNGVGLHPPQITLAGTVKTGDVLGYSSGWKRALATVGTAIQGRFVALANGVLGDVIPVSHCPHVAGYTGATAGGYVYVAEGTDNGAITQTKPTTSSDCDTIIGIAISATEVQFFLNSRVDSVV